MSEQKMRELRDQLVADINRPDGRWGMHGHSCVDDDYFQALHYVVGRIDEALAQQPNHPEIPESSPEQPAAVVELTDEELLHIHTAAIRKTKDWHVLAGLRAVIAAYIAKQAEV